jgi:heptosyltransferase-2
MKESISLGKSPRIIISRPDRVGDVVISTSCLKAIKNRYPNSSLFFLAQERMTPLLQEHPFLTGNLICPNESSFFQNVGKIRASFEKIKPDAIVYLHPTTETYLAGYLAKIPYRLGFGKFGLSWTLTHSIPYSKSEGLKHEAEYNFDLLKFLDIEAPKKLIPEISLIEKYKASLQKNLSWPLETTSYVVLNLTAFSQEARWRVSSFAELAKWIQNDLQKKVVVIGENASDSSVQEFQKCCGTDFKNVTDLSGKTNLGELTWLLKYAQLLVSRNTGSTHIAAAVDCPLIEFFGKPGPIFSPLRWKSLSEKSAVIEKAVLRKRGESNNDYWKRCFSSISVEEVKKQVTRMLVPTT